MLLVATIASVASLLAAPLLARETAPAAAVPSGPAADYPMVLGSPYLVDGVTYTPADTMNIDQVGYAVADDAGAGVTLSHRTLPLPSYVEVTSLRTGRTILARVERRGPMSGPNLFGLSAGAAAQLGADGRTPVRVRRVNPPETERALLRTGQMAPVRMDTPMSLVGVLLRKLDPALVAPTPSVSPTRPAATPTDAAAAAAAAAANYNADPRNQDTPEYNPFDNPPCCKVVLPPPLSRAPVGKVTSPPPVAPAKAGAQPKLAAKPTAVAVAPKPAAKPELAAKPPVVAAAAKPAPKPEPAAKPAAATAKSFIQVGAFSTRERAETAARQVGGTISLAGKLYRVRIAGLATSAEASAALAKARGAGYSDARIQRAD